MKKVLLCMAVILVGAMTGFWGCTRTMGPFQPSGLPPVFTATDTPVIVNTATPTAFATFTFTPGETYTPLPTATPVVTLSETPTPYLTEEPTRTPTLSPTVTPTPDSSGVTCYHPVVWGFKTTVNNYQYEFAAGVSIPSIAYAYFEGVTLKMTWYGGDGSVLEQENYVTGSTGFIWRTYVIQGTEDITSPWHLVVSEPSTAVPATYQAGHVSYLDDSPVTVKTGAPTPFPTPPCSNMPGMFVNENYSLEQYRFRFGNCTMMSYGLRYAYEAAQLALYDGADDLVFTEILDSSNSYQAPYQVKGTETAGTWHAVLYQATSTPPLVFAGPGDFGSCTPNQIEIVLY